MILWILLTAAPPFIDADDVVDLVNNGLHKKDAVVIGKIHRKPDVVCAEP